MHSGRYARVTWQKKQHVVIPMGAFNHISKNSHLHMKSSPQGEPELAVEGKVVLFVKLSTSNIKQP